MVPQLRALILLLAVLILVSTLAACEAEATKRADSTITEIGQAKGDNTMMGNFASVSAGYEHTCGVRADGSVACWGRAQEGQTLPPEGKFASVRNSLNKSVDAASPIPSLPLSP